jgi:hypothetical protein
VCAQRGPESEREGELYTYMCVRRRTEAAWNKAGHSTRALIVQHNRLPINAQTESPLHTQRERDTHTRARTHNLSPSSQRGPSIGTRADLVGVATAALVGKLGECIPQRLARHFARTCMYVCERLCVCMRVLHVRARVPWRCGGGFTEVAHQPHTHDLAEALQCRSQRLCARSLTSAQRPARLQAAPSRTFGGGGCEAAEEKRAVRIALDERVRTGVVCGARG